MRVNPPLEEEQKHTHWWEHTAHNVAYCTSLYKNRPCKAIRVTPQKYDEVDSEWKNYYQMCTQTEAYNDWQEMKKAFAIGDRDWMNQIITRVNRRCTVTKDEWGDNVFHHNEEIYMPKPELPDPSSPKNIYVVEVF